MDAIKMLWQEPKFPLNLLDGAVHVWLGSLDLPGDTLSLLGKLLSAEESDRAGRFRYPADQMKYIAAHGILHILLGWYLELPAAKINLSQNEFGKPTLENIKFNLSHSRDLALYAFAENREIGADIEYIRSELVDLHVANQFFARKEVEGLFAMPPHDQKEAFFACWTRKEAFIKAKGAGLSYPLDRFDVSIDPNQIDVQLSVHDHVDESEQWSFHALRPSPGYTACVVAQGSNCKFDCYHFLDAFYELDRDKHERRIVLNERGGIHL